MAIQASAAVYDPATDFSASLNPNGVWSYGYSLTLGGSQVPFGDRLNNNGADVWFTELSSEHNRVPCIFHNPTTGVVALGPTLTPLANPGGLALHPGQHDEFSVLRFTAPADNQYSIAGLFFGMDIFATSVICADRNLDCRRALGRRRGVWQ